MAGASLWQQQNEILNDAMNSTSVRTTSFGGEISIQDAFIPRSLKDFDGSDSYLARLNNIVLSIRTHWIVSESMEPVTDRP